MQVIKQSIKAVISSKDLNLDEWDLFMAGCMIGLRFCNRSVLGLPSFTVCTGLMPQLPSKSLAPDDNVEFEFDVSIVKSYVNDLVDLVAELCMSTIDKLLMSTINDVMIRCTRIDCQSLYIGTKYWSRTEIVGQWNRDS